MYRPWIIPLLLAAVVDASEASTMIFPPLSAASQGTVLQSVVPQNGGTPNLLPPSAMQSTQSAMPLMATPHVPVYQTYVLPPQKPPKPSPIYTPDSQNPSRRRHLGW